MSAKPTTTATHNRTFATRDSATALLRKLGVPARDYALCLTVSKGSDKPYSVDLAFVTEEYLPSLKQVKVPTKKTAVTPTQPAVKPAAPTPAVKPEPSAPKAKVTKEPKEPKVQAVGRGRYDRGRTVSTVARELILKGLTNQEVFDQLVQEFDLGPEKKYYPAWYRSELRSKGLLPVKAATK